MGAERVVGQVVALVVAPLRAQDRAEVLARSVTSARTALDLAVLQYREGTTDFTTVLSAQQTVLNQQDSLASTLGNIATSLVGVYRALGGGWEIREGEALVPPDIPTGDYACRTIKVGMAHPGLLGFVAYPSFRCRVGIEGGRLSFAKLTGSQRPQGRFFADRDERLVFLGTMQLGDEQRSHRYGVDRDRDMIGALERIGPQRWRLVLPQPAFESLLDVIELVPAS